MNDVTLQINLSPGDIAYAGLTVPLLVNAHQTIANRLLVVDCCRPPKSGILDPDLKFPLEAFNEKVFRLKELAALLEQQCAFTQVVYLEPGLGLYNEVSRKYLNGLYQHTHTAGGTGNMSYWAGIELTKTKYVLHYDGDMLVYQRGDFDWVAEGVKVLATRQQVISVTPRLCPPTPRSGDAPSLHEGRPLQSHEEYWVNDWFSTRCFLLDTAKLSTCLPLVKGAVYWEIFGKKLLRVLPNHPKLKYRLSYPPDPEILFFKRFAKLGLKRAILKHTGFWALHPLTKPRAFVEMLPSMIECMGREDIPESQRGYEDVQIEAWVRFLKFNCIES